MANSMAHSVPLIKNSVYFLPWNEGERGKIYLCCNCWTLLISSAYTSPHTKVLPWALYIVRSSLWLYLPWFLSRTLLCWDKSQTSVISSIQHIVVTFCNCSKSPEIIALWRAKINVVHSYRVFITCGTNALRSIHVTREVPSTVIKTFQLCHYVLTKSFHIKLCQRE